MLGWVLGILGAGYVCNVVSERNEYRRNCERLSYENNGLKVGIHNHRTLLRNYDLVNRFAKEEGFTGAVALFYYLADKHDQRFSHIARFLNKVRCVRNDIAHNGAVYKIDQSFLDKLSACVKICNAYNNLPYGRRLRLN